MNIGGYARRDARRLLQLHLLLVCLRSLEMFRRLGLHFGGDQGEENRIPVILAVILTLPKVARCFTMLTVLRKSRK